MGTTGRASYTMDVRTICETYANVESPGWSDQTTVDTIIDSAIPKVFNFSYPIFSEDYRNVLEHHILQHFYTREIAFQTVGRWKLGLQQKLNDIMPYYNKLYESQELDVDPFNNIDVTETSESSGNTTSKNNTTKNGTSVTTGSSETNDTADGTSGTETNDTTDGTSGTKTNGTTTTNNKQETTSSHTDAFSDTPQGTLSNVDNLTYLTEYRKIGENNNVTDTGEQTTTGNADVTTHDETNSSTNTNTHDETNSNTKTNTQTETDSTETESGETTNSGNYTKTIKGKNTGTSYSELITAYRETFLNIDMMIIEELEELFLQIYDPFGFA